MFKKILIPVAPDHGSSHQDSLKIARRLMAEGGKITLLAVIESAPSYVAEYATVAPQDKVQDAVLAQLKDLAAGQGDVEVAAVSGTPGAVIPDFAAQHRHDLILVQSHRPDLQDYFLGSTAARVVRRAHCAVFTLRD